MLAILPKIALVICVLVFVFVVIRVLFFYRKEDVKDFSELPFEKDEIRDGEKDESRSE